MLTRFLFFWSIAFESNIKNKTAVWIIGMSVFKFNSLFHQHHEPITTKAKNTNPERKKNTLMINYRALNLCYWVFSWRNHERLWKKTDWRRGIIILEFSFYFYKLWCNNEDWISEIAQENDYRVKSEFILLHLCTKIT